MEKKVRSIGGYILYLAIALFIVSCVDGYKDNETFSVGVTNTQLESPDPNGFKVTTVTNATTRQEEFKIEWPVVYGAGGYTFSLYIVDDPDNPVLVGEEEEFVDGCSIQRVKQEDTWYKVVVKTLGNEEFNNTGAKEATVYTYNSFIQKVATIPDGSDLVEWFTANPIKDSKEELAYELEPGGNYTINSDLDFGLHWITLRGPIEDNNRPNVTFGAEGRIITMAGLKLRFMNFDCSAMTKAGVVTLSTTPDESLKLYDANRYIISETIAFQSCNFKGVNNSLFYGSGKDYVIKNFLVSNCIVQLNSGGSNTIINCHGGSYNCIKDFKVMSSTFYNLVGNTSAYFLRYANASNAQPQKIGFPDKSASILFVNNTFYQVLTGKDFANNMPSHNGITTTIQNNIFYDCYRLNKVVGGSNVKYINDNFIYGVSKTLDSNDLKYGTEENPNFVGPVNLDPSAVNFAPTSSTILGKSAGDPRWLP